jgi:hypothetical protein
MAQVTANTVNPINLSAITPLLTQEPVRKLIMWKPAHNAIHPVASIRACHVGSGTAIMYSPSTSAAAATGAAKPAVKEIQPAIKPIAG